MFQRLINWIKKIRYKKNTKKLEKLKFGDEFWANIKKYEGEPIPAGHRIRPFMFIELKNDTISCLYESTKSGRFSIPITRGKSTTFVYYNKLYELNAKVYKHKKGFLKKEELIEIVRNGFTRSPLNKFFSKFQEYANVKVGDIVRYNNRNYYLFALDSVLATIYPIIDSFSEYYVRTSNHKYIAIFSPLQVKKESLCLVRPENPKLVYVIKNQKQLAKRNKRKYKSAKTK